MIIPCNKNITKLKNNYTIGITITLQHLLQSTKHALSEYIYFIRKHATTKKKKNCCENVRFYYIIDFIFMIPKKNPYNLIQIDIFQNILIINLK